MDIQVSDHAIIRRYQRFHKTKEKLTYDSLKYEIKEDFKTAKQINKRKYKSEKAYYIYSSNVIVTTYPDSFKTSEENINLKWICKMPKEKILIYLDVFQNDDYILLKNIGNKKLVLVNNDLFFLRKESDHLKTTYYILKYWGRKDLYNMEILKNIQSEFFIENSAWDKILIDINKYNFIYQKDIKELNEEEVIIYKQVLSGELMRFPNYFWQNDIGGVNFIAANLCVKYLIEKILKWDIADICNNFNIDIFKKYKLAGMLNILFNNNSFLALDNAYPNMFLPININYYKSKNITWYLKDKENVKKIMDYILSDLRNKGYEVHINRSLLSIQWLKMLRKYNCTPVINVYFKEDYRLFFKEIFNIEFTDGEIENYKIGLDYHKDVQVFF